MNILVLPKINNNNPYQYELYSRLEHHGIKSHSGDYRGPLPIHRLAKKHRPIHAIHVHWTHVFYRTRPRTRWIRGIRFLAELSLLKLRGVRLIWTIHNLGDHERRYPRLDRTVNRALARICDKAIVHCEKARSLVEKEYNLRPSQSEKISVVPHGNFISSYPNTLDKKQARAELGIPESDFVFLNFGAIRPYKGTLQLISTFKRLDAPNAKLVIAGKPLTEAIVGKIQEAVGEDDRIRCHFGFVEDPQIQVYMNAADVVALPYEDILTSGGAILAMSFGRPVISPRIGCNDELIGDNAGILYEPSADGLSGAMAKALHGDLEAMGRTAKQIAEDLDWEPIAARTKEVFEQAYNQTTGST